MRTASGVIDVRGALGGCGASGKLWWIDSRCEHLTCPEILYV
jgi:hypothetical protein